jgi:hypothetical protein
MYKSWKDWIVLNPELMTTGLVVACVAFLAALMWWTV